MLKRALEVLKTGVAEKAFPGAQAAVYAQGRVFSIAAGALSDESNSPQVNEETLYDLASITKPVATAACVGALMQEDKIGLEDTLGSWLDEAKGTAHEDVTVEMLLSHTAGFTDWLPLYKAVPITLEYRRQAASPMLAALLSSQPVSKPGTRELYSDLDYFLLGRIVQKASGKSLDDFFHRNIARPLGMEHTVFIPDKSDNIAPTELCEWRKKRLMGQVHDSNAWACGGVAGQAGLFGTALDMIAFSVEVIDGLDEEGAVFEADLLDLFCARPFPDVEGTFTLGWDTVSKTGTLTGSHFGQSAIGHHGYTGTSLWIDPEQNVAMALLTNHVYYGRDKTKIKRFRPEFFDAAWEDLSKS